MHRTEGANNVNNLFTDDPPATAVAQRWLNTMQEEIAHVIESAGISLLDEAGDTRDQLYTAIQSLITAAAAPRNYIDGMILSKAADALHDISVAAGSARDPQNTVTLTNAAAYVKQIDAVWAQGTNLGGMAAALHPVQAGIWYHFFGLTTIDGTGFGAGFDTSLTAANLMADANVIAAGFNRYRRFGSVLTDGSADIVPFYQNGDYFLWEDPALDINIAALPTVVRGLYTIAVPSGIEVTAIANINISHSGIAYAYVSSPAADDESPSGTTEPLATGYSFLTYGAYKILVRTSTASQIGARASLTNTTLRLSTLGWIDPRGRNA